MSLDNTSHPGGPGPDELVPSRYALRVGDIDVLVISDGVLPIPAPTLATNADSADLASGGDRLTFAGDAVFQVAFDRPEWFNGFEHDPEEAARVRVRLLRELAATGEPLVATHLSFPSVCHVAVAGDVFRCVPAVWDY